MGKKCAVVGCGLPKNTRGWCKPHYDAFVRTGDPNTYRGDRSSLTLWDRLCEIGWTKDTETGCNEWNGYRNELGYGQFRPSRGVLIRVHRVAYEHFVGCLSPRDHILHTCDNPACSEPSHLKAGRALDNMHDMRRKRRGYKDNWTHCPRGHLYPTDSPPRSTKNRCRECARERNRKYYARKTGTAH